MFNTIQLKRTAKLCLAHSTSTILATSFKPRILTNRVRATLAGRPPHTT